MKSKICALSIFLAFTISVTAVAASDPGATLILIDSAAEPGKSAHVVGISLESEPGTQVAALNFDLNFDPDRITFKNAAAGSAAGNAGKQVASATISPGVARVIVYGLNATAIGDGSILKLTFDIHNSASGTIPLSLSNPAAAAPDASPVELTLQNGTVDLLVPTFVDVPFDHWAHDEIEMLYQAGYVAGCSSVPLMYCPESTMTRAESAVFVERGVHGAGYLPPSPSGGVFADVPLSEWYAKWAEGLWADGYTAGCGTDPLKYCPMQQHTRAEGSVFFLRMSNGPTYQPGQVSGTFADVDLSKWYAPWVEAAYNAGLITACQTSPTLKICPEGDLDRAMAAYMMVQAKGLAHPVGLTSNGAQLGTDSTVASVVSDGWYEDFEGSVNGGYHNRSGCGRQEYTSEFSYRGQRSHKSEITVVPCPDNPLRYYPTFDGNFKLPALVTYWFYMDAESWSIAAGDRFSPLTVKETSGVPDARIFTTHVLSSGIMDCGHCTMTYQSTSVKVPLHHWHLQSAFIENVVNPGSGKTETHVTLYVDDQLVVEGIVDNTFAEGYVKHWHMGLYADREGNSGVLTMYNDEMRVRSVSGRSEAESLIQSELGGGGTCSANPDVTEDDRVDILDLQALANEILSGSPSPCHDLNSDEEIDVGDLNLLRDQLLSIA